MMVLQKEPQANLPVCKLLAFLSIAFIAITSLTIGQDFLESIRNSSSFYIEESLLFKVIWLLFIPMLALLHRTFQRTKLKGAPQIISFVLAASMAHLILVSVITLFFSVLFFEGRYDLYKIFSYTLAQDFYKIMVVYTCFAFVHFHLFASQNPIKQNEKQSLEKLMVQHGRNKTLVFVNEITKITSATPYITIHAGDKEYLHTDTLKSFYQKIDAEVFIQVHKTTIVNLNMVTAVKSRLNGDYDLQLKNGKDIRLSRTYVEGFKKRFNLKNHQDNI
ncbi:LytTR family DNA-binding domain-containing protein [Pedobacter sp.]|uniref:LytR/AlgR family response regulator transcription factor n=1 Tax=Pedobacter sp. TaxID=1411316 RepID=UPI0031D7D4FB